VRNWLSFLIIVATALSGCSRREYHLADLRLKIVPIDTDRHESYLGLAVDGAGRIFVGGREALFVYEPKPSGGFHSRRELYRFPPDTWIYDLALRGHDLYALTCGALYVFPDAVVNQKNLQPRKILWGFPMLHPHQCLHGMTFGPDGDLYLSFGDPVFYRVGFGGVDHWAYWKFHHGPDDAQSPYVGTGGVLRLSPDARQLDIVATGSRNVCGLAFDSQFDLFGGDNDQETDPDEFVPGRMLYFTEGAFFNWPRGWLTEKQPWRSDLLQTMSPRLGRYVPVGLCYYDDDFLPTEFRDCLYVSRWGTRSIPRCSLAVDGDAFKTAEFPFLAGADEGEARPVNITVGRDGRLFAVNCYMEHNDASPIYKSDLFMITRQDDPKNAPFRAFDPVDATLDQLFAELESPSWERRFRAHLELTRRGHDAFARATEKLNTLDPLSPGAIHLIWLAAANPAARPKIIGLTRDPAPALRLTALRALARFGAGPQPDAVFGAALDDRDPRARHAALIGLLKHGQNPPLERILALGASTLSQIISNGWKPETSAVQNRESAAWQTAGQPPHWETGSYQRQTAAMILARRASLTQLAAWCEDRDPARRLMGVLAIGFRMAFPAPNQAPDPSIPMLSILEDGTNYFGAAAFDTHKDDMPWCAQAGIFTTPAIWMALTWTDDDQKMIALLEHRLEDANGNVARQALLFLRLIRRRPTEEVLAAELGLSKRFRTRRPLPGSRPATSTNLPPAFQRFNWPKEAAKGDPTRGHDLFYSRGCNRCHAISENDGGSGGPSLAAAGARFNASYLAESVMAPNAYVNPLYRWTAIRLTDNAEIDGLVVAESPDDLELLLPSAQRQTVRKRDIATRQLQNHSPMPEGLITTPEELRDLLSFLTKLR